MKIIKILSGLLVAILFIGMMANQSMTVEAKAAVGTTKVKVIDNLKGTTLKVTWKKISKANGYSVYMSTSKDGIYEKVKNTKKTSYVTKELKSNVTYYFKVVAYKIVKKERIYGNYSKVAKCKTSPYPLYTVIDDGGDNVYFYALWKDPNAFGFVRCQAFEDCEEECEEIITSRHSGQTFGGYHSTIVLYKDYKVNGKIVAKRVPGFKWK